MNGSRKPLLSAPCAALLFAVGITACSSEDTPDAGSQPDASEPLDLGVAMLPEAGRPDAQTRPDSGVMDASVECIMNGAFRVDGTSVTVGETTARPVNRAGASAVLGCRRPSLNIGAPMRMQGCLSFVGAAPTSAELAQLEIAVFNAVDTNGMPVDPTYDPATGADRSPLERISPDVVFTVEPNVCPRGVRMVMGRDALGANALRTDVEYIVRTRSATTTAGEPLFVDQYNFGVRVLSDALEAGGASLDGCTPQVCSGRSDFVIARRHALHLIGGMTGRAIEGFANLSDHVGSGHALIQASDCTGLTMSNAAAGFAPAPAATTYLTSGLAHGGGATVTSTVGLLLGLGFTGTTTTSPRVITGAAAVSTTGMCAEPYAGRTFPVYPDAISLVRLGRDSLVSP